MIGDDAAPRAERTVALWNPPLTDEELGLRASALGEASKLMADLVERGLRTLCFAKSRRAAELIHRFTADRLGDDSRLSPYRAGYTPQQRREIERRLLEGELLGVVGDERARARDRRRAARLRDLGRLPRHGRLAAAAVGPRGTARARAGGARRQRGRARPVLHARAARRCSAAASRRRSSTTRTRACSTATSARPRSRRRSTTATARCSATRRSSGRPCSRS